MRPCDAFILVFAFTSVTLAGGNFVSIASAQRSGSTNLQRLLVQDGCTLAGNEIFQNISAQSGDAWQTAGADLRGGVLNLTPDDITRFVERLHRARCQALASTCANKCTLVFKQFSEHLTRLQHKAVFDMPRLMVVVLERNFTKRWRSKVLALTSGDWDTTGAAAHKQHLREIPKYSYGMEALFCKRFGATCGFRRAHTDWYQFVHAHVRPEHINTTFERYIHDGGQDVVHAVRNWRREHARLAQRPVD